MANRILKWVIYTLVFALLPTLISLLFSLIFGFKVNDYSTELLFFTIMIHIAPIAIYTETKPIN